MPKARQDLDCMAGRDFRGQNVAKKARKQGFQRKKRRAQMHSNASSVLGNARRAQKAADEVAEKQNVSQKRGKIQTAWQDVISEARMSPKS